MASSGLESDVEAERDPRDLSESAVAAIPLLAALGSLDWSAVSNAELEEVEGALYLSTRSGTFWVLMVFSLIADVSYYCIERLI